MLQPPAAQQATRREEGNQSLPVERATVLEN